MLSGQPGKYWRFGVSHAALDVVAMRKFGHTSVERRPASEVIPSGHAHRTSSTLSFELGEGHS
jgi:hypothetical protein